MDLVDRDLEKAEREASPDRFPGPIVADRPIVGDEARRASTGTTSSSEASEMRREVGMSRIQTSRDLERHPTELSRIQTTRSQHLGTVGRTLTSRSSKKPLPEFGAGKPYPPQLPDQEEYVVEFDGPDDPLHPMNWRASKKLITAVMLAFTSLTSTFTSSIFSASITPVSAEFGVAREVGTLGVSLYVIGYAFGPVLWGPLSELQGRKLPIAVAMFGFSVFQFGTAVAKDLQTVIICRFFGGFFASAPLAIVAAVFSDMFDNKMRGLAITGFSMTVFCGPLFAPFIGGFIIENPNMGWRWTEYIPGIMGLVSFVSIIFGMTETYPPIVLVEKASELRRRTRNWGIHAKQEEIEVDFRELVTKNFTRPLRMLVSEPILLLLSIYMAFIYGLLYLFLTAYALVFQEVHQFSPGIAGLCYLGVVIGMLIAGVYIILTQPAYIKKLEANNNVTIPEWRLPPVVIGAVFFAVGLFWFGWSGYKASIPWIVPTLSGLFTGFGLLSIFLQSLNYIIDSYLMFAASAIAANTLLRSLCGGIFPLFATYMYEGMGIQWANTLLGCLATIMIPIPVLFIKYGAKLRQRSKFAPTFPKPHSDDDLTEDSP